MRPIDADAVLDRYYSEYERQDIEANNTRAPILSAEELEVLKRERKS